MAIPTLPPPSAKAVELGERVKAFLDEHIIRAEPVYHRQLDEGESRWHTPPIMNELKEKAKKAGLWPFTAPFSRGTAPDGMASTPRDILPSSKEPASSHKSPSRGLSSPAPSPAFRR